MKIVKHYTLFTDSHKVFVEPFIKTYKWEDNIDLVVKRVGQECPSAVIKKDGWRKTMYHKMGLILDAFKEVKNGDVFIFTDIDIMFYKSYKDKVLKDIENKDIIFSVDLKKSKEGRPCPEYCSGIIAIKASAKTKKFFEDVIANMKNFASCQPTINHLLVDNRHGLKVGTFGKEMFNTGFLGIQYTGSEEFEVPHDTVIFHANFTSGVKNKLKLMQIAYSQLLARDFNKWNT
jgi:hypothetical protein